MILVILLGFGGMILGSGLIYILLSPKLKQTQQLDSDIIEKNKAAKIEWEKIQEQTKYLKNSYAEKYKEFHQLRTDLEKEQESAERMAQDYYNKMMENYKHKFQYNLEKEKENYQKAIASYQDEYLETMNDFSESFQEKQKFLSQQINNQKIKLDELIARVSSESSTALAAVEANKRLAEQALQTDFYKLVLSKDDLEEIEELHKCGRHLRNPEPLNKVIWKVYYENPYTSMVGRVLGPGIHCGIYKITNLKNGMCYVGQCVDAASRWRQHIKRGLGAETPTKNKLYPAMAEFGVENFSFELIEECPREQLNEREDYWQDFFKAKDFGYSIK